MEGVKISVCPVCSTRCEFPKLLTSYQVGVEVGVYYGTHADNILSKWPGLLHLIDPYLCYHACEVGDLGIAEAQAKKKLSKFPGRYQTWREMDSYDLANRIGMVDFVYVDGAHTYEYVDLDIRIWWDHINPGGLLAGHDFMDAWTTVIEAVTKFSREQDREVFLISALDHCPCGDTGCGIPSWYIRK
jgi:hypothetical protein